MTIITFGLYPIFLILRAAVRSFTPSKPSRKDILRPIETDGREGKSPHSELLSAACPYCGVIQNPPPQRKKKCMDCGQLIFVKKEGKRRRLMTEKQVKDFERTRRDEQWKELSKQVEKALRAGDWEAASQAYNGQAAILFTEGRKHLHIEEEAHRCHLRSLQGLGIKKVQVLTCEDERVCSYCHSLSGKVFSIDNALETMPLPGKQCTDDSDKNPHGGRCRCLYLAVIP